MGRLTGLELYNFKSYRGTAKIGFGTSYFTSIIGPNGAGKSNMMDAISFVLGVRSSHLRSTQLKDLIYRARLSGVLHDETVDAPEENPTSAYVMASYEKADGEVIELKRSINASGSSTYSIDGRTVSAAEYSDVLKSENILIKAKNFLVFQGDVEKIASQSALELSKMIELVSGSADFEEEYDRLKAEHEKAHEDTQAVWSTKRTYHGELKQYKEQYAEVTRFENKQREQQELIQKQQLLKIYDFEKEGSVLAGKITDTRKKLEKTNEKIEKEESELKKLTQELAKESLKVGKLEKQISKCKRSAEDRRLELIPIDTQLDMSTRKIKEYTKRIEDLSSDLARQQKSTKKAKKQLESLRTQEAAFKEKVKDMEKQGLSREALAEYKRLRGEFLTKAGDLDSKRSELHASKAALTAEFESLEQQKEITTDRLSELEAIKREVQTRLGDVSSALNDTMTSIAKRRGDLTSLRTRRENFLREELELTTKLKEVLVELNELNAAQRESAREAKLRENCTTLMRLFPGVKGLVHDLCKPKQKRYEAAVATILGKNFDAIVVDDVSTAKKCIEYLKEHRNGVASFIPLSTVNAKPPMAYLRNLHDKAKPAFDVIDFSLDVEKAMHHVCGNAVVCDDMAVAQYIRWERKVDVKVVTLEGSVIHRAGLMTGGKTRNEGKRWGKNDGQVLNQKKNELKLKIDEIQQSRPSELAEKKIVDDIAVLEEKLPALRAKTAEIEHSIHDLDAEHKNQCRIRDELNEKISANRAKTDALVSEISALQEKLGAVQDSVYGAFCAKYNIQGGISAYEESQGEKQREVAREKAVFAKSISAIENKLVFEEERLLETEQRLAKLEKDKSKFDKQHEVQTAKRDSLFEEISRFEAEAEVSAEELAQLNSKISGRSSSSGDISGQVGDLKLEVTRLRKQIANYEADLEKTLIGRLGVLRYCKMENIAVPLTFGSLDDLPFGESDDHVNIIRDFEYDFSSLEDGDNAEALAERIQAIKEELATITPNMKAVERLREVEAKLADIDQAFKEARDKEQDLSARFRAVKDERHAKYMSAFTHISSKIDFVYKELTKSRVSSTGGSAYLTLEDEDEPYLSGIKYHAMPPLKRFKDMELLSGGEKTIAALALLFAIHSFHPSPFFVLDEVDAALDNANVNQIANYIKNNCGPDFQFIVISLKNSLFERSDALVGIYREHELNSSKALTLDLRDFPEVTAN